MRKRNRESTHRIRCFKYRAYWKEKSNGLLPDPVYAFAKKQQVFWNLLATEQERRWNEWRTAHPGTKTISKDGVEDFKFEKPQQSWRDEYAAFAKTSATQSGLGWDSSEDVATRIESCLKRLAKGGGTPRL